MQEGIEAGHIAQGGKRQRAQSPAAWPLPVSMPDHSLGLGGGFRPTGVLVQRWVQNQLQRGAEHPPLRARAAGKNAAFELLEADFKAFVSEINLGVDLTWY